MFALMLFAGGYVAGSLTPHWAAWKWTMVLVAIIVVIVGIAMYPKAQDSVFLLVILAYAEPVVGGLLAGLAVRALTLWRSDLSERTRLAITVTGFLISATIAWLIVR